MEEWARELHRKGAAERSQVYQDALSFCTDQPFQQGMRG